MLYSFKPVTVGVHVSLGDICLALNLFTFSFSLRNFLQVFNSAFYVRE